MRQLAARMVGCGGNFVEFSLKIAACILWILAPSFEPHARLA